MSQVLITESYISNIASAIRAKTGQSASYTPSQMASAIGSIVSAGALSIISKTIFENGSYSAEGHIADAYSQVVVNVPNTYSAADEGKVVESGELSAQGTLSVFSNSIYDTTNISQVSVAIPAATLVSKTISENGTYYASSDSADGFSQVVVDVAGSGGEGVDKGVIEGGITSIYDSVCSNVRQYCFRLAPFTDVEMTKVKTIEREAFYNMSSLNTASFPECTNISQSAFAACNVLSSIYFPSLVYAGSSAFAYCYSLQEVSLPECLSIRASAFQSDNTLVSVYLPKCKSISDYAFSSCRQLSDVSIPVCECVSNYAFNYCTSLQTITLPVCSQINNAFLGCIKLSKIILLSNSVCSVKANGFNNTPIAKSSYLGYFGSIYVPASLVDSYKAANYWSAYSDRITAYVEE